MKIGDTAAAARPFRGGSVGRPNGARWETVRLAGGNFGLRVFSAGLAVIFNLTVAYLLGPERYGVLAMLLSIAGFLSLASSLGIPAFLTREIAARGSSRSDPAELGGLVSFGMALTFAAAVVAGSVFFAWGESPTFLKDRPHFLTISALACAAGLVPVMCLNLVRAGTLRGLHRPIGADIPELLVRPVLGLLLLGALFVAARSIDLQAVLVVQLVAVTVAALAGFAIQRRQVAWLARPVIPVGWFRPTSTFWLIAMCGTLVAQFPLYLLAFFGSASSVGLFAVASQFGSIVLMATTSTELTIQARVSAAYRAGDSEALQRVVTEASVVGVMVASVFAIGIFVIGPFVAESLGEGFRNAAVPLRILSLGYVLYALCGPSRVLLNMTGGERSVLAAFVVNGLLVLVFGSLMVYRFEAVGAAVALVGATSVVNFYLQMECYRRLKIRTSPFALLRS